MLGGGHRERHQLRREKRHGCNVQAKYKDDYLKCITAEEGTVHASMPLTPLHLRNSLEYTPDSGNTLQIVVLVKYKDDYLKCITKDSAGSCTADIASAFQDWSNEIGTALEACNEWTTCTRCAKHLVDGFP